MIRVLPTASMVAAILMLLVPASAIAQAIRYRGQNAELKISKVADHHAQIVLTPLDAEGTPHPKPHSTVLVDFPTVEVFKARELAKEQQVQLGKLKLVLKPNPLTLVVHKPTGEILQEVVIGGEDGTVGFQTKAPVLGLGEGHKQFDRRESKYPMKSGQISPWLATHGATTPVPFLIGTDGWALFVQGPGGEFDLGKDQGRFIPRKAAKGNEPLELYISVLQEPADALAEYVRLTGKAVLPPRWVMGYMQSHRSLAGPAEPVEIVKTFRDKQLPLDTVIYLGTGYTDDRNGPAGWNTGHGSVDFNPRTFDRPAENIKALLDLNVKVVLHVNRAPRTIFGDSILEKSTSKSHISNYWALHKPTFALGINGWWPDEGNELAPEGRLVRHRCYYEGPLQERPNERPWSLHRTGYAGVQRYGGWIWSGDPSCKWETLATHVPVGINHSLSLTPFWGSDTGGFVPTKEFSGELYTRWFQFSAFNPLFRSHGRTWKLRLPWGWNTGDYSPLENGIPPAKAELRNAAVEPICKKYLELRYQLLPYNYTLMAEARDTGLPPMRALWLHYPKDPQAVKLGDEYLWGRDILVAPVTAKGATERKLYLPEGEWYDFWTRERQPGGREITRKVDLATMPLYVRAGAILPLDPIRQYTAQKTDAPTTIRIYPGRDGEYRWYEDDGATLDYLKGKLAWTRLRWNDRERKLIIEPDVTGAGYQIAPKALVIELATGGAPQRVRYEGKRVEMDCTSR